MKARKATTGRSADEMRTVGTGCPTPQIIELERVIESRNSTSRGAYIGR